MVKSTKTLCLSFQMCQKMHLSAKFQMMTLLRIITSWHQVQEECKDLYQRMKNGLLKQPTVRELDQKARSLREDLTKHWIPREIKLLQNRINQANEKGRRRELYGYMEQKLKLEIPSEQSRLVSDIPKIIPEIVETEPSPDGSSRDYIEQEELVKLAMIKTSNSGEHDLKHTGFAHHQGGTTDVAVDVIELSSDNDEEDANIADTSAGRRNVVENPKIPIWHCLGPYGERNGPYSMSVLKQWSETASYPLQFKVWKIGQSDKEAILLTDALRKISPGM